MVQAVLELVLVALTFRLTGGTSRNMPGKTRQQEKIRRKRTSQIEFSPEKYH